MKQRILNVAAAASVLPHLFCCVLPTISSLAGVGTSLGLSVTHSIHMEWVHEYEVQLLVFSGLTVALAGAVQLYAGRMDCHKTGCCHEPCSPRKDKALVVFFAAGALFFVNLAVHFLAG